MRSRKLMDRPMMRRTSRKRNGAMMVRRGDSLRVALLLALSFAHLGAPRVGNAGTADGPSIAPSEAPSWSERLERATTLAGRGRFDECLRALDGTVPPDDPMLAASVALLRARACFELADFPCAERELRSALSLEVLPPRVMSQVEEELARELSSPSVDAEAWRTIERVTARNDTTSARRVAAGLALRAQDFAAARRHADALVRLADSGRSAPNERVDGGDASSVRAYARFVRGIARAREGELEEAIGDLEAGLELSDAERDARFELALAHSKLGRASRALAHLWEILIVDP